MPQQFDFTVPGSYIKRRLAFDDDGTPYEWIDQINMDDVLDFNTALRNADRESSSLWGGKDYVKVASIPLEVAEAWFRNEGINIFRAAEEDWARLLVKLNDWNEWGALRTDRGDRRSQL